MFDSAVSAGPRPIVVFIESGPQTTCLKMKRQLEAVVQEYSGKIGSAVIPELKVQLEGQTQAKPHAAMWFGLTPTAVLMIDLEDHDDLIKLPLSNVMELMANACD